MLTFAIKFWDCHQSGSGNGWIFQKVSHPNRHRDFSCSRPYSKPKWANFPSFYFPKRYLESNKNTLCNPYLLWQNLVKNCNCHTTIKRTYEDLKQGPSNWHATGQSPDLTDLVYSKKELFTSVEKKSTFVAVVHTMLESKHKLIKETHPPIVRCGGSKPCHCKVANGREIK